MRYAGAETAEHPLMTSLEPGTYYWCRCGRTKNVPYCDGSHEGSEFTPLEFTVAEGESAAICNCGLTGNPPYCDGSHGSL